MAQVTNRRWERLAQEFGRSNRKITPPIEARAVHVGGRAPLIGYELSALTPGLPFTSSKSERIAEKLKDAHTQLDIEIHRELNRVRAHAHGIDFMAALVIYPSLDQPFAENIIVKQELIIPL